VTYAERMTLPARETIGRRTSRPGRRVLVAADLAELAGPDSGIVEVPHRIVWMPAPGRTFDLSDDYDRIHLYEVVLREAVRFDELRSLLNGELLRQLWPELHLSRGVRAAWELRHPVLARQAVSGQAA
jgi:hypothetical protein